MPADIGQRVCVFGSDEVQSLPDINYAVTKKGLFRSSNHSLGRHPECTLFDRSSGLALANSVEGQARVSKKSLLTSQNSTSRPDGTSRNLTVIGLGKRSLRLDAWTC